MAEMEREPARPQVEFLMAVAGPTASLVLAGALLGIESVAASAGWPTPIVGVLHYLGLVNLVLAIFNLVPAFPLDGGRMLRAALWKWTGDLHAATRIASRIGAGFGIGLMVLGALAFIQGSFIAGMWWVLIGAFLRSAANSSYRQLLINDALGEKRVGDLMTRDPLTVPPGTTIEQLLEDYVYRHHHKLLPVTSGRDLVGCVTVADVKQVPREERATTTVGEVATPCSARNTVRPDMAVRELVMQMGRPGAASRYMVVQDGRLLGVISLRDLNDYVALKLELE
jgi:CBS domain-containing protein